MAHRELHQLSCTNCTLSQTQAKPSLAHSRGPSHRARKTRALPPTNKRWQLHRKLVKLNSSQIVKLEANSQIKLHTQKALQQQQKPIVLVDMDGVIANFELGCLTHWQAQYPDLPHIPLNARSNWDICVDYEALQPGLGAKMRAIFHQPGFCTSLQPVPNSIEALQQVQTWSCQIYICTAPTRNAHALQEKAQWIQHWLGPQWRDQLITSRDKTLIRGDVLIDDKPAITGLLQPTWKHIVYTQPYNLHTARPRLTWQNWQNTLAEALANWTPASQQS